MRPEASFIGWAQGRPSRRGEAGLRFPCTAAFAWILMVTPCFNRPVASLTIIEIFVNNIVEIRARRAATCRQTPIMREIATGRLSPAFKRIRRMRRCPHCLTHRTVFSSERRDSAKRVSVRVSRSDEARNDPPEHAAIPSRTAARRLTSRSPLRRSEFPRSQETRDTSPAAGLSSPRRSSRARGAACALA